MFRNYLPFSTLRPITRRKPVKTAREQVPKALRQYAKRYANKAPEDVLAMHRRFPT